MPRVLHRNAYGWVAMSPLSPAKRSPLPAPLREDVIELLSTLLLAEIERNPDTYRAGPEGGPTVTPTLPSVSGEIAR
jgi:hypothetical protein